MKVLNKREQFLSDFEVSEHLKDIKERYNWTFDGESQNNRKLKKRSAACGLELEIIAKEVLCYLKKSPSAVVNSREKLADFMTFLNGCDLMKVEKLQISNTLPRTMVNLYAVVEECDQRIDEETCNAILDRVNTLFPLEEEEDA